MANAHRNDVDPPRVHVRASAPVVVGPPLAAWRMARLARFVRLATAEPVHVTGNKLDALLDNLSDVCLGQSLLISPEIGAALADILDLLAAQMAQPDATKGARP
jgi:hypothetical protein